VVIASNKRLQITKQSDAIDMFSFMLNSLHEGLNGTRKTTSRCASTAAYSNPSAASSSPPSAGE